MEQLRCVRCNRRLMDIDSPKFRVRLRCTKCKQWLDFEKSERGNDDTDPRQPAA